MRNRQPEKALQELKATEKSELLDFLVNSNVRKSRTAIKSLLAHKQVKVNGKLVTQFDFALQKGDNVEVMKYDQSRREKRLKGMKIVFEDEYIIVIDKETGLLSVSTEKEKQQTAYSILNEYVKKKKRDARIFVIHRLDRQVSGMMIFTKDQDLQTQYQRNWSILVPVYDYVAAVYGTLDPEEGVIRSWLTENKNFLVFSNANNNGGLEAVTHYQTLKKNDAFSLVNFRLETRRKNQIRAQMKQLGHPVVGDKKYGAETNPARRMALHAHEMRIKHPISGRMMDFKSTIPKAIMQLLNTTKKNDDE